jgi:hypothetical protein
VKQIAFTRAFPTLCRFRAPKFASEDGAVKGRSTARASELAAARRQRAEARLRGEEVPPSSDEEEEEEDEVDGPNEYERFMAAEPIQGP